MEIGGRIPKTVKLKEVFQQNFTKDPKVALLGLILEGIDGRAKNIYFTNIANSSN